jgi:hypothetical protein
VLSNEILHDYFELVISMSGGNSLSEEIRGQSCRIQDHPETTKETKNSQSIHVYNVFSLGLDMHKT